LHQRGLAHGDIKPANFVFPRTDPLRPTLIDLETLFDPELKRRPIKYTVGFVPPYDRGADGFAYDRYAVGVTIAKLIIENQRSRISCFDKYSGNVCLLLCDLRYVT